MTDATRTSVRTDAASSADPSAAEVRAQLQRILESPVLQGSARRRDLLRYLVEETLAGRGGQLKGYSVALAVFGRDESFDPASDPVVRLEAGRLRRALDTYYVDADRRDELRITIPKGAYVAEFERRGRDQSARPDEDPTPDARLEPGDGGASRAPLGTLDRAAPRHRRPAFLFAALLLVAAGVLGLTWLWPRAAPVEADARGPAIIVLPFEVMDQLEDTRLLASAMTQDLVSDLMRFPDLRLYSAPASFRQDAREDPVALGKDLGVAYVLRGSVQSDPAQVRVSTQLVDASTGEVVWSGSYDRTPTPNNLIGMRSELSSAAATALGEPFGVVNAATAHRLAADDAPSMASYSCVLSSYEYRRTFEDALFAPALGCLEEAVVRDPDYADAWAMLGWLNLDAARQDMVPAAEHPGHVAAAYEAASRAVEIDRGSQRGFEALAAIAFSGGDYAEAERLQREALALNPHDPEVLAQLGWRLAVRGNWDEGLPFLEQAIDRSADPPGWYFHLISAHEYLQGNYAAALTAAERSARVGSAIGLSLAAISQARLGDMHAAGESLAAMSEAWPLLANDPAAAYGSFQADDSIVEAMIEGLRDAGLAIPETTP